MRESKLLGQILSLGQNYRLVKRILQHSLSLYRYFTETTTTDLNLFLQVVLQFCNNSGLVATSCITMLFCPLLDD